MTKRLLGSAIALAAVIGCSGKTDRTTQNAAGTVADSTAAKATVDSAAALSVPPGVAAVGTHGEALYDHPAEPSAVPLLDYYGRELEIWSARGNKAKLSSTVGELKRTWEGLRPKAVANGGGAVAAKTDSLVTLIVAAKTPAEHARLAKPFLDVVDELEKVFVKP